MKNIINITRIESKEILTLIVKNANALELSTCFENDGTIDTLIRKIYEYENFTGNYEMKLRTCIDKYILDNYKFYCDGIGYVDSYREDAQFRNYIREKLVKLCGLQLKKYKRILSNKKEEAVYYENS